MQLEQGKVKQTFDLEVLKNTPQLQVLIKELSELIQITPELELSEVLSIASLCTSGLYKVKNPETERHHYCINYFITIAESGDRKSEAQRVLLEEVKDWISKREEEYERD